MQSNNGEQKQEGDPQPKQSGLSWSTPAAAHTPVAAPAPAATTPAPVVQKPLLPRPSKTSTYAGMIVVGVVAGVLVAWGFASTRQPAEQAVQSGTATTTGSEASGTLGINTDSIPALGSDPGLTIMSPQAAGKTVVVHKAIVSVPTWIVVYENKDGKPGNALGAALFFPERQTGNVELLRATVSGASYLAVKQVDNGDRKFSLRGDPILEEGGETQWITFTVK